MKTHSLASCIRPGVAALLLALAAASAPAQRYDWTGPADGDWADAANWTITGATIAPVSGTVHIQNGRGPLVSGSTSASLTGLYVGTTGSGGTLTLAGDAGIAVGGVIQMAILAGDRATLLVKDNASLGGGDLTFGNDAGAVFTGTVTDNGRLTAGGVLLIGYGGTSSLTATGSSSLSAGTLNLGRTIGSKGVVTLAGSSTMSALNVNLGYYRGSGELVMRDNAVLTTAGNANLGATDGANNSATTSSGVASLGGSARWTIGGTLSVGNFYRGELTIGENATVTAGKVMIGTLQGSVANMKGHGIVTLNGDAFTGRGTLETSSVTRGAGLSGTLAFNGGILRATQSNAEFLGATTGAATLVVTTGGDGAFIDSNGFDIGISPAVAFGGAGGLTKLGGGSLTLGGTIAYTGDTVVKQGALVLTAADQLAASRAVSVETGATLNGRNTDQTFNNLSGGGAVNLDSGKLTVNSDDDTAFTGVITAAGGLRKTGAGALSLGGDNIIGGIAEATDGILGIGHARALGTGTLVLSGGAVLRADADAAIANAVRAEGIPLALATNDTGGMRTLGIGGAVSGTLGALKTGLGNIVFSNDSTALSGPVDIQEGGLMVAGLGASAVTVAGGAGFGGSGDIHGNVTFTGGGFIQLGPTHNDSRNVTPSTLNILGTLALGGDTLVKYDTYGAGAADKLVANSIAFGGALSVDFANIREGIFTLITVNSGSIAPSLPGSIVTSRNGVIVSAREVLTYSLPTPQTLQVAISKTNAALTWTGADGDDWNYNTAASWSGADTRFIDGDRVIFAGTDTAGSGTISIEDNGVTAADMTVTGGKNYTFAGNGRITTDAGSVGSGAIGFGASADGRFTMQGTGTVTFENASNVFQNGIVVERGVVVGNVRSLGIGSGAVIANSGTLVFRQDDTDTYSSRLTGAGVFIKTGSAALFLDSPDSVPSGAVRVDQGALFLTETARLGSAAVTIAAGATFGGSGTAANAAVQDGGTLQVGLATTGPAVGAEVLRLAGVSLEDNARLTGAGTLDAPVSIGFRRTGVVEVAENRFLALAGDITGSGGLAKRGPGDLRLLGKAGYTGETTIEAGRLVAGAPDVLAAQSDYTVMFGAALSLGGYGQSVHSVLNEGSVVLGAATGAAGARLIITGDYTGGVTNTVNGIFPGVIELNLVASDHAPTAVDTVHVGGAVGGTSRLLVHVTDNRAAAASDMLLDIGAVITRESGDMPTNVFTLTDGTSVGRVVIGLHDYGLYYYQNEARIVATTSAEIPAALAVNATGIAVNRATLASLGRRFDQIRSLLPADGKIAQPFQLWLQGYYRRDKFDDTLFNNARSDTQGVQLGGDYSFRQQNGGLAAIGFF
ncbi:beta strand repeat-containing protein, partial [Termitidicoccus mucosus]